ncbi:hypothetical protein [Polynucleobacter rarus]|uniref:hypothetical protein n=1 Tax=Polynucleobacter rarus TaxID=556055 RepID=UPI001B876F7E|nr:hypothetical protein [Polynucleobacter rarus]
MTDQDQRCCGSGVCIINQHGQCWCGQVWDGKEMVTSKLAPLDSGSNSDQSNLTEKKN